MGALSGRQPRGPPGPPAHRLETAYSCVSTAHGAPATRTVSCTSRTRWPRLEPVMVTRVPPSTGPVSGSTWPGTRAAHTCRPAARRVRPGAPLPPGRPRGGTHRVDAGRGAPGGHRLGRTAGLPGGAPRALPLAPHAAVLGRGRLAEAAVPVAHGAVEQHHWGGRGGREGRAGEPRSPPTPRGPAAPRPRRSRCSPLALSTRRWPARRRNSPTRSSGCRAS